MRSLERLPVGPGVEQWRAWSTTVRVVTTDPSTSARAARLVMRELDDIDAAASRFRADSEVSRVAAAGGRPVQVSRLLAELVAVAVDAARETDGDVDPTLGAGLASIGYDRDIDDLVDVGTALGVSPRRFAEASPNDAAPFRVTARRHPTWRAIRLDGRTLTVPAGVVLDLGATAKAWAADRCAALVAEQVGGGAMVAIGGDVAVAGDDPADGWTVLVQDGPDEPASTIRLTGARGVATSSILGRSWRHWNERMHHILDPVTGRPAAEVWRTVSVAGPSCLTANVLSTAAAVRGTRAIGLLRDRGLPARLVASDGSIVRLNGWPKP